MTIEAWLKIAKKQIPAVEAELIMLFGLEEVLPPGVGRSFLVAHGQAGMSQASWEKLDKLLERRVVGEPLAYILGTAEFLGWKFKVNPAVLIPRPETEEVVEVAAREAQKMEKGSRILEIGTGSGVIAVSLALMVPDVRVTAVDISEEALVVARENAERLGVKVEFQRSDLTEGVDNLEDFGLVVANLPYVDESWEWIDRRALGFEPRLALFAEEAGLGVYRRLLDELVERGWRGKIILEADKCQEGGLKRLAEERKMRFESAKLLTNMITCAIMEV